MQKHVTDTAEAASTPVLEIDGARATIRLNRPRHLNRLQPDDLDALLDLFDRISRETPAVADDAPHVVERLPARRAQVPECLVVHREERRGALVDR